MQKSAAAITVFLVLLILFSAFAFLSGSAASLAGNASLMLEKMERFADTGEAGVDKAEYPKLAEAIAGYLKGQKDSAQLDVQAKGGLQPAFSEKELLHLSDVRGLVLLSGLLRRVAGIAIVLCLAGYLLLRRWKPGLVKAVRVERAFRWAAWLFCLPLLLTALWAAIDFDSIFHLFHRLLFRNELWLLDPKQDLLLQLMPTPFFTSYLWDLLRHSLFFLLALPLAAYGLNAGRKGGKP